MLAPLSTLSKSSIVFKVTVTFLKLEIRLHAHQIGTNTSSVESQKGVIEIQRCSVENQKGAVAIHFVQQ